jgi:katanin p60 ATPase-containing subunit A1
MRLPLDCRVLQPMPHYTGQYRELAETVSRDIYSANPNVRWSDIVELEGAKTLLQVRAARV